MKKVEDLKKDLRRGDYPFLRELTGISLGMINSIFQGHRNADTPTGRKLMLAAEKLIESRKQLWEIKNSDQLGGTPSKECA